MIHTHVPLYWLSGELRHPPVLKVQSLQNVEKLILAISTSPSQWVLWTTVVSLCSTYTEVDHVYAYLWSAPYSMA